MSEDEYYTVIRYTTNIVFSALLVVVIKMCMYHILRATSVDCRTPRDLDMIFRTGSALGGTVSSASWGLEDRIGAGWDGKQCLLGT